MTTKRPGWALAAWVTLGFAAAAATTGTAVAAEARTLVVLPFDMVDTSLQGEMNHGPLADDVARLKRTEAVVQRALAARDEFDILPREPIAGQIEQAQQSYRYLYACNGCEIDLGRDAGAELVLTGWVQKVSNLIININATLYDVERGEAVGGASVDMRGNTHSTWRAAALYLVNHSLPANYHSRRAPEQRDSAPP